MPPDRPSDLPKLNNYQPTRFMLPTSHYDTERADRAVRFIENLCHTKGKWDGKPFWLLPWQEQIIRDIFGIVDAQGHRQFRTAYVEIPKKNGKALALDTPIPTPDGWRTMADLSVGDMVFDETGKPCRIIKTTDIMYGHKCYRLTFSNGEQIVADADHQWLTNAWIDNPGTRKNTTKNTGERHYSGSVLRVRTSEEIANTLLCNKGTTHNHSITLSGALQYSKKELPIPPYTFGAWLGDGASGSARITNHLDDYDIIKNIVFEGVPVRIFPSCKKPGTPTFDYSLSKGRQGVHDGTSIQEKLKALRVFKNKHIPEIYLHSSIQQRMEILRGLMDTDGYCSKAGQCEFTTISEKLKDDVVELIASLGMKVSYSAVIAKCNGKDCGTKYRIRFYSYKDNPCFSLERKAERLKERTKNTRAGVVHIVSAEEVDSVPVKCIQVDSESHLYLAGKMMIPTHNSELAAAVALYLLYADSEPSAEVYGAAADRQQASIVFDVARRMVDMSPALAKRSKLLPSTKRIVNYSNAGFYQVLSAEVGTKHGLNVSGLVFDEVHTQPNRHLYDVLTKGSGDAREQPLYFLITTAGTDRESICYELHCKALDILSGKKIDPTFYPTVYGLQDDDDWTLEENWYKANPSLGMTIQIDQVRQWFAEAIDNPAEENVFKQLRLNMWVSSLTRFIPEQVYDLGKDPIDMDALEGRECFGGLDLSSTGDITAFVLMFPPRDETEKYIMLPFFWIPEDTIPIRVRRASVPYDVWHRQGYLHATEGNVLHYGYIEQFIADLGTHYNIREIAFDRWGATQMTQDLEGMGFTVVPFGQGYKDMSPPTKEFYKLLMEGRIQHGGQPVMRWMSGNVVVDTDPAGNIKPTKQKSPEKIDGIVAAIMALDRCIRHEAEPVSVYDERGLYIF